VKAAVAKQNGGPSQHIFW